LCADVSEHSVCTIFIGSVSRNDNQDEIVGVFTQEKVWLKNSVSQSERGGCGRGMSEKRNRLWRAKYPKWRLLVSM
jgi:hypothetical protein